MRSARIERQTEMTQGISAMEPGEHKHTVCLDCYAEQLFQVFRFPRIVGIQPCDPLCVHVAEKGLACPAGTSAFTIIDHADRFWYLSLCNHGGKCSCQETVTEASWVRRDEDSDPWA